MFASTGQPRYVSHMHCSGLDVGYKRKDKPKARVDLLFGSLENHAYTQEQTARRVTAS
jgi:hypothetical protein